MFGLRKSTLLIGLIVLIVVAVWAFSYHTFEFKGGMGIHDNGFFSYPRYRAEISELPLWKNGQYSYTLHGLPPGPLDFALLVTNANGAHRQELISLPASVNAAVMDSSGNEICAANGKLSDAKDRASWVLASSEASAAFWHPRCQQLPISRFNTYTIKLAISGADNQSPHWMLRPMLSGGGIELP